MTLDQAALDDLVGRVQHDVDKGLAPGAQLAIGHGDEIVFSAAFGTVGPEHLLPMYSTSKVLPAAAIWRLVGDGRLAWDQPVCEILDWFVGGDKERVTIDHLLLHVAGLERAPMGPGDWETLDHRRQKMATWYATSTPGETFAYHASSGMWVLAEIVAALAGTDHCTAIHQLVTEPLGLPRMLGVDDTERPVADLVPVAGTTELDLGEVTDEALLRFNQHEVRLVGVPGGGGLARAADLASLYQGILHNRHGLWDAEVLADVTSVVRMEQVDPLRQAPANRTRGLILCGDDGFGIRRGFGTENSPGAFGHDGAAGQVAWADPATGLSFAFLTTALDGDIVRQMKRSIGVSTRACRVLG